MGDREMSKAHLSPSRSLERVLKIRKGLRSAGCIKCCAHWLGITASGQQLELLMCPIGERTRRGGQLLIGKRECFCESRPELLKRRQVLGRVTGFAGVGVTLKRKCQEIRLERQLGATLWRALTRRWKSVCCIQLPT